MAGFFIRRMTLAFEKLSFSEVTSLYTKYKDYCKAWQREMGEEPSMTDMSMSIVEIMGGTDDKQPDKNKV